MTVETKEAKVHDFLEKQLGRFPDRSIRHLFQNKENIRGLLEIIASDLAKFIDFSKLVPLNPDLISEILQEREADVLFRAPFKTEERSDELLIYILLEHQSTVDEEMGFRLLLYMMLIWDQQRRGWKTDNVPKNKRRLSPILPIVFYTGDRRWNVPLTLQAIMDLPKEFERFVPQFDTLFLSVKETEAATLTKTAHPLGWILTVLQKEKADSAEIRAALIEALIHFGALPEAQAAQRREAIGYLLDLILHRRSPEEHEELIRLVDRHTHNVEVDPMARTMAEELLERGFEQGIEQGIEQGARENAIENILLLLTERFPNSDAEGTKQRLQAIHDIERLRQLLRTAMKTPNLETFLQGLDI